MTLSVRSTLEQQQQSTRGSFVARDVPGLRLQQTPEQMYEALKNYINVWIIQPFKSDPKVVHYRDAVLSLLTRVLDGRAPATSTAQWAQFEELVQIKRDIFGHAAPKKQDSVAYDVTLRLDGGVALHTNGCVDAARPLGQAGTKAEVDTVFLANVSASISRLRSESRAPTTEELLAIQYAYYLLERGAQLPQCLRGLGAPGLRPYTQTYLAITDPGPDHIKITCQDEDMLRKGVTVHVEYIDRTESSDRDLVEAYRLPSQLAVAKVRLHVADTAPCSVYIGRPVFEGLPYGKGFAEFAREYRDHSHSSDPDFFFHAEVLKAVHGMAATCTAMFMEGVSECKIAIERMSERQGVYFMRALHSNVARDASRQFLSAAFNLFTPIYSERLGRNVEKPMDLARLAIHMTLRGGFDKVTWDGSSSTTPSPPVTETLNYKKMLKLAHDAHRAGLLTYVSAGMNKDTVHVPVEAGIDGIGIGVDLHYMKERTLGAFDCDKINTVITNRDAAANTTLGKGGRLLAYLDYKYFEQMQDEKELKLNEELWQAMLAREEKAVEALLAKIPAPAEDERAKNDNRYMLHAQRLLKRMNTSRAALVTRATTEADALRTQLKELVAANDTTGVRFFLAQHIKPRPVPDPKFKTELAPMPEKSGPLSPATTTQEPPAAPLALAVQRVNGAASLERMEAAHLAQLRGRQQQQSRTPLRRVVIDSADLSHVEHFCQRFDPRDCYVIGDVVLPAGVTEQDLIRQGAIIIKPKLSVQEGFDPIRKSLYTVEDLEKLDQQIYKFVQRKEHTQLERLAGYIHDGLVLDLLRQATAGRLIVGVMGGHSMSRLSPIYAEVAHLCWHLARAGYTIISGGGPGAMESANLGAYMHKYGEEELEKAIAMLCVGNEGFEHEYDNVRVADEVRKTFASTGEMSLGVPTWLYGHEPFNRFASQQAKFLSNAVREDILVNICNCGIIYTEGSAGTRTEIAQYVVPNCYSHEQGDDFSKPMIFFKNFWIENTVYQSLLAVAQREDAVCNKADGYSKRIYWESEGDKVFKIIEKFCINRYGTAPDPVVAAEPSLAPAPASTSCGPTAADAENTAKRAAAEAAVAEWVTHDGMTVGVGSGTTAAFVVDELQQLAQQRHWTHIVCVPSSFQTRQLLLRKGLTVSDLMTTPAVDVDIDGADRCDCYLNLIKGGGGCLLQEKVLASSARAFVVVAHWEKDCPDLAGGVTGPFPVPLEVLPLSLARVHAALVEHYGDDVHVEQRMTAPGTDAVGPCMVPFVTDNSNFVLDVTFTREQLSIPARLEEELRAIPGVLEVGLFTCMVTAAYFGVKHPDPQHGRPAVYKRMRLHRELNEAVTASRQEQALRAVLDAVRKAKEAGRRPVVELDVDLTALMPFERTIYALKQAGREWGIHELVEDPQAYTGGILPGYTCDAWNAFAHRLRAVAPQLMHQYADLDWEGKEQNKFARKGDPGYSVFSSFHTAFWANLELMAQDIPTPGLRQFVQKVEQRGGVVVYLSGRWLDEQLFPTLEALRRVRARPNVVFGNPNKLSDADNKAALQQRVVQEYGTPVAYFDDRAANIAAVSSALGDKPLCVQIGIPGYTCNPDIAAAEFAVSTFDLPPEGKALVLLALATAPVSATSALVGVRPPPLKFAMHVIPKRAADTVRVCTFNCENLFLRFKFKKHVNDGEQLLHHGWCIDKTDVGVFDADEKRLTAACIMEVDADIIALEEVEDLVLLDIFNKEFLGGMYAHCLLIEGNDQRYINVGVLSKFPLRDLRTHRDDRYPGAPGKLFSRDCLEVEVDCNGTPLHLLVNHFKSMIGGREQTRSKRRAQCERVLQICKERRDEAHHDGNVVVLGDFNDYCDGEGDVASGVTPLAASMLFENVLLRLDPEERWTHFWKGGKDPAEAYKQLDYLLLAQSLAQLNPKETVRPQVYRKGCSVLATRYRGERFSGLPRMEASDHCPLYMDIVLQHGKVGRGVQAAGSSHTQDPST
eukprot:TRINITY_DN511_c0_g1_i2.p1 TRINITY_DN511_c0_g1~~TRINITY_DN511_c0_g1_i2.p1  ORF type:complete len:1977 (-),score=536.88 TRINITY_DN511_c0_g1_i2:556-6486(-)